MSDMPGLNALKERSLKVLRRAIRTQSVDQVIIHCRDAAKYFSDDRLPFIFASVLAARRKDFFLAAAILAKAPNSPFIVALLDRFKGSDFRPNQKSVFGDPQGYLAWTQTEFAQKVHRESVKQTVRMVKDLLANRTSLHIVDIGTGNGTLISDVLVAGVKTWAVDIDLTLVDSSKAMLTLANKRLTGRLPAVAKHLSSLNISRERDQRRLSQILGRRPLFFSSAALHHIGTKSRVSLMRRIASNSGALILLELEGNHNSPATGSIELTESVANFYGFLIENLRESNVPLDQQDRGVADFLLPEAIDILVSPGTGRRNFHSTEGEWVKQAKEAGLVCRHNLTKRLMSGGPRLLMFSFCSKHW